MFCVGYFNKFSKSSQGCKFSDQRPLKPLLSQHFSIGVDACVYISKGAERTKLDVQDVGIAALIRVNGP